MTTDPTPALTTLTRETEPSDIKPGEQYVEIRPYAWPGGPYTAMQYLSAVEGDITRHRVVSTPPIPAPLERPADFPQLGDQVAIVLTRAATVDVATGEWCDSHGVPTIVDGDLPDDAQVIHLADRPRTAANEAAEALRELGWDEERIVAALGGRSRG